MSPKRSNKAAAVPPLPELRQDVVLTAPPRQERYGARVAHRSDDEVVLVLTIAVRDELAVGDVVPMTLEFTTARGLVRVEGEGSIADGDLVGFRLAGTVDVDQRRDFVRVAAVRPAALAPVRDDGRPGDWIDTLTVDVSGNGLLVAGPDTIAVGDEICFRVRLIEGEAPLEGRGRIARITDAGQRGVAIEELDGDERRRLVRFVFEQQRIARQRTRADGA